MLALDEMQASNNINMNLAALSTPAVLLVYSAKKAFQFLFYTLIKLGKSREETYGSFLHVLIEIERLLVVRDAPPTKAASPTPPDGSSFKPCPPPPLASPMQLLNRIQHSRWDESTCNIVETTDMSPVISSRVISPDNASDTANNECRRQLAETAASRDESPFSGQ
jgi:hypothetical protein